MRFTPAHAGNTHVNAEEAGSLEVHPRSRGEYLLTLHQTDPEPGSSPLTRGIRGPKPENVEKDIITPLVYLSFQVPHPLFFRIKQVLKRFIMM